MGIIIFMEFIEESKSNSNTGWKDFYIFFGVGGGALLTITAIIACCKLGSNSAAIGLDVPGKEKKKKHLLPATVIMLLGIIVMTTFFFFSDEAYGQYFQFSKDLILLAGLLKMAYSI